MGKRFIRTHVLLVGSAITFLLAGCLKSQPDYRPFGDGMKAIGICLVVCAVVKALVSLIGSENGSRRRERRSARRKKAPEGR